MSGNSHEGSHRRQRFVDTGRALAGGAVAAAAVFVGTATVGRVTAFRGRQLLEATLPTIRFLTSSVLMAAVTIMALMLTLLGLTLNSKWKFHDTHYSRIRQISAMTTIALILSVAVLMFLSIPIEESESLRTWYDFVYYAIAVSSSVLGGLVISIVLMLNYAIRGLVDIGHPGGESHLIAADDEAPAADQRSLQPVAG